MSHPTDLERSLGIKIRFQVERAQLQKKLKKLDVEHICRLNKFNIDLC